jgi:hypothetical protein
VRLVRRGFFKLIERREPHFDERRLADPETSLLRHAILSDWPKRGRRALIVFLIVSLLLHIALIAAIHFNLIGFGIPDEPIPVRLVTEIPQPMPEQARPKPPEQQQQQQQQQQKQQQQKPPPQGRLASDEFGDPDAKGDRPTQTHAEATGAPQPKPGEAPPPPAENESTAKTEEPAPPHPPHDPLHSDAPDEQNMPETREQLAQAGTMAPPPSPTQAQSPLAAKPDRKPSPVRLATVNPGGARRPTDRPDDPNHGEGHKAKYPGPDATYDEYLAYILELTDRRLVATLPADYFRNHVGGPIFRVAVRPSGAIVWFTLARHSAYPEIDTALTTTLNQMGNFPPLPDHLQKPDGEPTELTFEAVLEDIGDRTGINR